MKKSMIMLLDKMTLSARLFIVLAILVMSGRISLSAQEAAPDMTTSEKKEPSDFRYELRIGWGGIPLMDTEVFYDGYSPMLTYDRAFYHPSSMESIYMGYRGIGYMTGIISAEMDINFKHWFALTVGIGVNGAYQDVYDPMTGLKSGCNRGISVSVLPEARFNWLNRSLVRMYSAAGLGIVIGGKRNMDYGNSEYFLYPAFQLTPVGISIGRKVYGFAELGLGTQFMGGMAGVGIRL